LLVLLRHTRRVSSILREYIDLDGFQTFVMLTMTSWGFAMGWNYALLWLVSLPLEIIAASITISFWEGSRGIDPTVWVTIFFVAITVINLFGVKGLCNIRSRTT
jgi:amino acid permease